MILYQDVACTSTNTISCRPEGALGTLDAGACRDAAVSRRNASIRKRFISPISDSGGVMITKSFFLAKDPYLTGAQSLRDHGLGRAAA